MQFSDQIANDKQDGGDGVYTINRTTITLTRGDTFLAEVNILRDNKPYTPEAGDRVRFALKHSLLNPDGTDFRDPDPLILKDIPIDTMVLRLDPEDTKSLGFGRYAYDIEITFANGIVDTFISNARFELTPEVH